MTEVRKPETHLMGMISEGSSSLVRETYLDTIQWQKPGETGSICVTNSPTHLTNFRFTFQALIHCIEKKRSTTMIPNLWTKCFCALIFFQNYIVLKSYSNHFQVFSFGDNKTQAKLFLWFFFSHPHDTYSVDCKSAVLRLYKKNSISYSWIY